MPIITLEQAKRAFPGGKMKGGEYVVGCPNGPHANHLQNKLSITEKDGKLLLSCRSCNGQRDLWAELQQRVSGSRASESSEHNDVKPWPDWLPTFPDGWTAVTETARRAIADKRADYTPGLEVMQAAGVMEAKGRFICFPCKVGDELRNLRVLDFSEPKSEWQFLQFRPGHLRGTLGKPDTAVLFSPQPLEMINPFEPLFVVEGQWDAITMQEHGFACVSLLSAGQPTIAPDVLDHLGNAAGIYFAYDNDGGTGFKAVQRLAPLLPAERTFFFPWSEWGVKDACELRSKSGSAEQFKQEVSFLLNRVQDEAEEHEAHPEREELVQRLQSWNGARAVPELPTGVSTDFGDIPNDVLDGCLGEICLSRMPPDLPRAYAWLTLVAAAANLVPENPDLRTNLYACLVGDPGTGKSTSIDYACSLLALPADVRKQVLAGSAEKLTRELEGSKGAPRLVDVDELGHLLSKAQIDRASFPYVLSRAYYDSRFTVGTGDGAYDFDCRLSLIGGVVTDNFSNVFGASTAFGLYDRMLFGLVQKPDRYLRRPIDVAPVLSAAPVSVRIDSSVWDERDRWIKENPDWSPRVAEMCLRVAVICASVDGREVLTGDALGPAKTLCAYQHRARLLLKPSTGENANARCAEAILGWFDAHANRPATKRSLYRGITANRYGPSVFDQTVRSLIAVGELVKEGDDSLRRR